MRNLRVSKKALIYILLIAMLMATASTVSAAKGGQPGKPTDTPPGQAKKATPTPEASVPTRDDPVSIAQGLGQGTGADIITEFNCRINMEALGGGDMFTTNSRSVSTPSGNTVLKCRGVIPPELVPSQTVLDRGFLCVTFMGDTYESRKVFTPSGIALLTCTINGRAK